jgi:transposase
LKLPDTIEECHILIRQLYEVIDSLTQRVIDLENRLNQNSGNSHRPPSSDGLRKPAFPKNPSKGKVGGKEKHRGGTLKKMDTPDKIVSLHPEVCAHCSKQLSSSDQVLLHDSRQVFDLPPIQMECTEYRRMGCTCTGCGHYTLPAYPYGVDAAVQYGPRTRSLVVLLHERCCLPVNKIQSLFLDLFSAPINEGTIYQYQKMAFQKLEEEEGFIKSALQKSKVVHADETGLRVEKKLQWLHTLGNERFTMQFVHNKRGYDAHLSSHSFLPQFRHWLIHDFWSSYFRFDACKHAMCGAHVLRELKALSEQGQKWADRFHRFLLELYRQSDEGRSKISKKDRQEALKKYHKLLSVANKEEPVPISKATRGRIKKSKGRNLLERLDKYQDEVLAFAWHRFIPFTNNLAERDIRPSKSKLKVAGCFRSIDGARAYARIHSFLSTVRKHQLNSFNELVRVFQGRMPEYRMETT